MQSVVKLLTALVTVAGLSAPALAAAASPAGIWQTSTGESRYEVSMCGDGTQLCAKLIWLSDSPVNNGSEKYLNTFLIEKAKQVGPNKWSGDVHAKGQTLSGTVTLRDANTIDLRGCLMAIFCKGFVLNRHE
ncbi:MAG TPA: DUF2147 domain-containing protein [Devosiaceae bacterium]|jgi:uncharacterized protein (DUF2147 family)